MEGSNTTTGVALAVVSFELMSRRIHIRMGSCRIASRGITVEQFARQLHWCSAS